MFKVAQKTVTSAGTAEAVAADTTVESGLAVTVKAMPDNTGSVYVANTATEAQTAETRYPLIAGEGVTFRVRNLNQIFVDADTSGEGVIVLYEPYV